MDPLLRLRRVSEAFTGAPFRLEVLLAIGRLPTDTFATIEVRNLVASDVSQPVVSGQLRVLVAVGFLDKLAHGHYRRLDGPVWDFVRGLEQQAWAQMSGRTPTIDGTTPTPG